MEANDSSITFLKTQAIYMVPFFQRAYVWDDENWEGLWNTLASSEKDNFLGSIILKLIGVNRNKMEYLVIDGQQRITTLSILTQALIDGLELKEKNYDYYSHLHSYIFNRESLFSKGKDLGNEKIKLINSRNDIDDYQNVINGNYINDYDTVTSNSKIVNCYCYFRKMIEDKKSTEEVENVITNISEDSKKTLVVITLQGEDNEQAIFDTINRAGVTLSSSDIIKNNLFDKLSELLLRDSKKVEDIFDKTWGKVFEKDIKTSDIWLSKKSVGKMERTNLELFLQAYAVMNTKLFDMTKEGAKLEKMSEAYKNYCNKFNLEELKEFINDICSYAETYRTYFIEMKEDISNHGISYYDNSLSAEENQIKHILQILSFMDTITFDAYILNIIHNRSNIITNLKSLETYIVRDYVFKRSIDKNFNNECVQMLKEPAKYTANYFINSKKLDNSSLKNSLMNMTSNDVAKLLLYWVELKKSYDSNSEIQNLYVSRKSHQLEHVMPQSPEEHWPITYPKTDSEGKLFTDEEYNKKKKNIDEARNRLIYYIGNMTLLTGKKNIELSNSSFKDKKYGFVNSKGKHIDGYCTSSKFLITDYIKDSSKWTEEEITHRTEDLFNDISSIWPI